MHKQTAAAFYNTAILTQASTPQKYCRRFGYQFKRRLHVPSFELIKHSLAPDSQVLQGFHCTTKADSCIANIVPDQHSTTTLLVTQYMHICTHVYSSMHTHKHKDSKSQTKLTISTHQLKSTFCLYYSYKITDMTILCHNGNMNISN